MNCSGPAKLTAAAASSDAGRLVGLKFPHAIRGGDPPQASRPRLWQSVKKLRNRVLRMGLTDPGERRSVTRGLGEYILPLDRIPGVPPWNTDKRRLAPAGSLHNHMRRPCIRIPGLKASIRANANLCGERSERRSHKRRCAGEVHKAVWGQKRERDLVLNTGNGLHPVCRPGRVVDDSRLRGGDTHRDCGDPFRVAAG